MFDNLKTDFKELFLTAVQLCAEDLQRSCQVDRKVPKLYMQ